MVIGCSEPVGEAVSPPSTLAAVPDEFCEVYESVANMSRQEMMAELLEVAPSEILGSIKRAIELSSSFEDDRRIDEYLEFCRRTVE